MTVQENVFALLSWHYAFSGEVNGRFFPDALANKTFVAKGSKQGSSGETAWVLDYSFIPQTVKGSTVKGRITLRQDQQWAAVVETSYEKLPTFEMTSTRTMSLRALGDLVVPKLIEQRSEIVSKRSGKYVRQSRMEYDLELRDVPDREFTLSAFGLPEPEGIVWEGGGSRGIWFWIGGAVAIILAIVLGFLRRKRPDQAALARKNP